MRVKIENFRGIKSLEMAIINKTEIVGPNGSGKSTILDAVLWCLTGRDSKGRSNYKITTVGTELDAVVEVDVDGVTYKRILSVIPCVSRGEDTGKTTESTAYSIDGIVVGKKEFDAFVDEKQPFWVFTDAGAWERTHWKDRLKSLCRKAGVEYKDDAVVTKEINKLKKDLESLTAKVMILEDLPVCPNCADEIQDKLFAMGSIRQEKAEKYIKLQAEDEKIALENKAVIEAVKAALGVNSEFVFEIDGKPNCEAVIECPEGMILFPHANTAAQMKMGVQISKMFVETVILDNAESVLSGVKCCVIKCGGNNE